MTQPRSRAYDVVDHAYDVVVVADGAGMRATPDMAAAGLCMVYVTKVFPARNHTVAIQGDMAAARGSIGDGDDWRFHMCSTVEGSDWLREQAAIEFMCREATPAVLELDSTLAQAAISPFSASGRMESRGAHARDQFPKLDDEAGLKHTLAFQDGNGVRLAYRPVHLEMLSTVYASIPPEERVY